MTEKAERLAKNVVTSENRADFMAEKLDLTPIKEQESLNERFRELTTERNNARNETKAERDKIAKLEAQIAELNTKLNPPKVDEGKPNQADPKYKDNWTLYVDDMAEWKTNQKLAERDATDAKKRADETAATVMRHWTERQNSFKAETPDYLEALGSSTVVVSDQVRDAIIESDVGPQILYHLAKNPDVAEKIQGMTVSGALRALGKLEAKLEGAPIKKEKEEPAKAGSKSEEPSKAPTPISPLKGGNAVPEIPVDSAGNFKGDFHQYKELRKAKKL